MVHPSITWLETTGVMTNLQIDRATSFNKQFNIKVETAAVSFFVPVTVNICGGLVAVGGEALLVPAPYTLAIPILILPLYFSDNF